MSNKLTREVKYLNESDRPKKVEPLSFSDWHRHKDGLISRSIKAISDWQDGVLNEAVREYATYLQEFSAEEVGVEFKFCLQTLSMSFIHTNPDTNRFNHVTMIGKFINSTPITYDMFKVERLDGSVAYFLGNVNSGKF